MGVGGGPSADISRKRGFLASLDQVRSPQVLILLTLCQEQATDPLKLSFFIRETGQQTESVLARPGPAMLRRDLPSAQLLPQASRPRAWLRLTHLWGQCLGCR